MSTRAFLQDNDCESAQEWGHLGSPGLRSGEGTLIGLLPPGGHLPVGATAALRHSGGGT